MSKMEPGPCIWEHAIQLLSQLSGTVHKIVSTSKPILGRALGMITPKCVHPPTKCKIPYAPHSQPTLTEFLHAQTYPLVRSVAYEFRIGLSLGWSTVAAEGQLNQTQLIPLPSVCEYNDTVYVIVA